MQAGFIESQCVGIQAVRVMLEELPCNLTGMSTMHDLSADASEYSKPQNPSPKPQSQRRTSRSIKAAVFQFIMPLSEVLIHKVGPLLVALPQASVFACSVLLYGPRA